MADESSENVEMDYEDSHSETSSDESIAEITECVEEEELDSKQ
jgi:hypothetical protein